MSCRQTVTSLPFFQNMANLAQSRSQIPDAQPVKVIFSLTITFYLKTENRTKKKLTALTLLLCVKVLFLQKTTDFLQKNIDISKIKRFLVLKGIFSETTYQCVFTYQISSFQHNSSKFQTGGVILPRPLPTSKRVPKKPTQIRVNKQLQYTYYPICQEAKAIR